MSHSGAGPLDAGMRGSPWVGIQAGSCFKRRWGWNWTCWRPQVYLLTQQEKWLCCSWSSEQAACPKRQALICYIQWEGWGLLWGERVLHSNLISGFFYTPYLFQQEALVGSHGREMEKLKTEIQVSLYWIPKPSWALSKQKLAEGDIYPSEFEPPWDIFAHWSCQHAMLTHISLV